MRCRREGSTWGAKLLGVPFPFVSFCLARARGVQCIVELGVRNVKLVRVYAND